MTRVSCEKPHLRESSVAGIDVRHTSSSLGIQLEPLEVIGLLGITP